MVQTAGKRKGNSALAKWVKFIKKVQREEKLSYRDAMMRAKVRKDKGENWKGRGGDGDGDGDGDDYSSSYVNNADGQTDDGQTDDGQTDEYSADGADSPLDELSYAGGRKSRRSRRGGKSRRSSRSRRGGRARKTRRHR